MVREDTGRSTITSNFRDRREPDPPPRSSSILPTVAGAAGSHGRLPPRRRTTAKEPSNQQRQNPPVFDGEASRADTRRFRLRPSATVRRVESTAMYPNRRPCACRAKVAPRRLLRMLAAPSAVPPGAGVLRCGNGRLRSCLGVRGDVSPGSVPASRTPILPRPPDVGRRAADRKGHPHDTVRSDRARRGRPRRRWS
jgi:hypothetical protein